MDGWMPGWWAGVLPATVSRSICDKPNWNRGPPRLRRHLCPARGACLLAAGGGGFDRQHRVSSGMEGTSRALCVSRLRFKPVEPNRVRLVLHVIMRWIATVMRWAEDNAMPRTYMQSLPRPLPFRHEGRDAS